MVAFVATAFMCAVACGSPPSPREARAGQVEASPSSAISASTAPAPAASPLATPVAPHNVGAAFTPVERSAGGGFQFEDLYSTSTLGSSFNATTQTSEFAASGARGILFVRSTSSGASSTTVATPADATAGLNLAVGPAATAADRDGHSHVVYFDLASHGINHAVLTDAWHIENVVPPVADTRYGSTLSMDFANDGTIHVVYFNAAEEKLMHAWQNAGTWHTQQLEALLHPTGVSAVVVDSHGHPHVAYCTQARAPGAGGYEMRYATLGETWSSVVVLSTQSGASRRCGGYAQSSGVRLNIGLDIDARDQAHIAAYVERDISAGAQATDQLVYFRQSSAAWLQENIAEVKLGTGSASLVLGARDSVHVAFSTTPALNMMPTEIRYATRAQQWNVSSVANVGVDNSVSDPPGIAIDASGHARLSFISCVRGRFGTDCSIQIASR